jgi:hypothetical protein
MAKPPKVAAKKIATDLLNASSNLALTVGIFQQRTNERR